MRILTFLLFAASLAVHARPAAQTVSLTGKNIPLMKVFSAIEKQTGFFVASNRDILAGAKPVTLAVHDLPLKEFLSIALRDQPLSFHLAGKTIFISRKSDAVSSPEGTHPSQIVSADQPPVPITGRITDSTGTPLAGATVSIRSKNNTVTTNSEGLFTLDADAGDVLIVSYIGYETRSVILTSSMLSSTNNLAITLRPSITNLDNIEIVVTGYQTLSKERSTGSFERIGEKTLNNKFSQNIFAKLEGEVAGLTTDTEGKFIVRGLSSINANTDPLVVVDGFPVEQGANTINPNDVESITVLKDAAAASIWGIRATNGVIVIVTKKGSRTGKLNVSASINTALTPKPDLFAAPLGDPATQVAYQESLFNNGSYYQASNLFSGELNGTSGRVLNPVGETLLLEARGDITPAEAERRLQELANTDIRNEYSDLIQQTEKWQQYNVSVSGGSKNYDFITSASYNSNDKQFMGTGINQYLLKFANTYDLTSKLKLDGSVNFSQSKENFHVSRVADGISSVGVASPTSFLNSVPITSRILDEEGNYVPMQSILSFGEQSSQLALSRGLPYPWTYNIKQELENTNNVLRETAIRLQTGASYNILKGLNFTVRYQYEWSQQNTNDFHNEQTLFTRARVNLFTRLTNGVAVDNNIPVGGILDLDVRNQRAHTFRSQLNFDRSLDEGKHHIAAIAGYEVRKTLYDRATDRKYGYDDQSLSSVRPDFRSTFTASVPLTLISVIPPNSINEFVENRFISYYANAAYSFDRRYTVSASTRLDDTNLFGSNEKYKNIPLYSLGFKWNLYNDFLKTSEVVDDLQFRVTYGTNGNVDRSTSPFLQARIKRGFPPYTGYNADIISVPNPELRLEKTRTLNIGADFSVFNRFIRGSIEYYIKDSEDLLAFTTLNPTLGVGGALINNGTLRNEGFDINLRFEIVNSERFSYFTTGIFSVNTNTLKKVDVPNKQIFEYINGSVAESGAALRTIYSYDYRGLDANGNPQFINELGHMVDVKTFINSTDALIKNGSLIPKFYGSWINNFEYKSFFLRTLTTFKAGHVFRYARNNNVTYLPANTAINPYANVAADFNQRWQSPGDELITDIPAVPAYADRVAVGYSYYRDSEKFVDNASHIRLSQLNLGYSVNRKVLNRLGVNSLQIALQADNVAVWNFNRWDVDPESNFIPITPTYTINISASF